MLCDIQSDLNAGLDVDQALRKAGIGITAYYRWKSQQQDPASAESLRLRDLETENGRLKDLVAGLALDREMLQEALEKKPGPPRVAARSLPRSVARSPPRSGASVGRWA